MRHAGLCVWDSPIAGESDQNAAPGALVGCGNGFDVDSFVETFQQYCFFVVNPGDTGSFGYDFAIGETGLVDRSEPALDLPDEGVRWQAGLVGVFCFEQDFCLGVGKRGDLEPDACTRQVGDDGGQVVGRGGGPGGNDEAIEL